MSIRVLLADDHAIFRRGLRSLLAEYDDIEIVAEADNSPAALRQAAQTQPDVALLDVQMDGASGIAVASTLRQQYPELGIIILTTFDNDE
ncbi:MAG: response regulator transcription factor, partial [Caldilinea sp.]